MRIDCQMQAHVDYGIDAGESIQKDKDILAHVNKHGGGVVRLYCLDRPSLILTADQNANDVDIQKLESDGIPVHRHIRTGGGALFIGPKDFTTSVAIGKDVFPEPVRGLRIYQMFSNILMKSLAALQVETKKSAETLTCAIKAPTCFGGIDKGELINTDGAKVYGGSHTRRTHNGYFHYGFLALSDQNNQIGPYLRADFQPVVQPASLEGITFEALANKFIETMYGDYPEWRLL